MRTGEFLEIRMLMAVVARKAMHAFGSFELVDYAYFLEEQFYPLHDALCEQEASWAYRAWHGETLPVGTMDGLRASMEDLFTKCFGRA